MLKETFLNGVQGWNNHLHLLWPALEATTGEVVELGMGDGSTYQLHYYCEHRSRLLCSYENNLEWGTKFKHLEGTWHKIGIVQDWDTVANIHTSPDVVLIDHAPGERRYIDVQRFADRAKIIVIHDSEPEATGYMMDKIWHLFKYRKDFTSPGAWATAVSNFIDVTKFVC